MRFLLPSLLGVFPTRLLSILNTNRGASFPAKLVSRCGPKNLLPIGSFYHFLPNRLQISLSFIPEYIVLFPWLQALISFVEVSPLHFFRFKIVCDSPSSNCLHYFLVRFSGSCSSYNNGCEEKYIYSDSSDWISFSSPVRNCDLCDSYLVF